jgi:hypothetical protein
LIDPSAPPQLRLLQCWVCRSVEELPDYDGPPEHDVVLQYADEKHGGSTEQPHHRALHRVEKAHWEDSKVRRQIHAQMWTDTTGFVPEYYATKQTLQEDAAKCFQAHRRTIPCIDYQDSSKRLGNPAAGLRRWLSKELRNDNLRSQGPVQFLCSYCPYQTVVDRAKREAGLMADSDL